MSSEERWDAFVHWAGRIAETVDLDAEERNFKMHIAGRVRAARDQFLSGDPDYLASLKTAVSENQLVHFTTVDEFTAAVDTDADEVRGLLRSFWVNPPQPALLDDFVAGIRRLVPRATAGVLTNLGSVLMMGVEPEEFPPYKDRVVRTCLKLVGDRPSDDETSPSDRYGAMLDLLAELRERGQGAITGLRDPLDAHGLAWTVAKGKQAPETWPADERRAYAAWHEAKGDPAKAARIEARLAAQGDAARREISESEAQDAQPDAASESAAAPARPHLPAPTQALADELCLPLEFLEEVVELWDDRCQLVLQGPPGTGKTFLAQRLAEYVTGQAGAPDAVAAGRMRLVQFHPSYAYEDFFEGYRPAPADDDHPAGLSLQPGPLRLIAAEAAGHPGVPYVLVIDEMNRANIPKVFGELYYLLEYRDRAATLQYSPETVFRLPENLFVLGTMNTADRSIAALDAALHRRFTFVDLRPDEEPVAGLLGRFLGDDDPAGTVALLRELNRRIAQHDPDLEVGPSYFLRRGGLSGTQLVRVWRYDILPLLREQFLGELDRAEVGEEFGLDAVRRAAAPAAALPVAASQPDPAPDDLAETA